MPFSTASCADLTQVPTYQLVIAPAARNDLRDIYQYGLREWGQAQADHYLSRIKDRLWLLTRQPQMGVERPKLLPDARSFAVAQHLLFYRLNENRIEIIRILHGRQDPHLHLKRPETPNRQTDEK